VSIRVLYLEDDLLLGETLVDLLEDEGYEVSHYLNGQDALDATFERKFDLYLLDINVPLIDGVSLLSDLRKAEDTTPAIFLTSHKDKEMLERGFVSGADDFIKKPFDNDELLWRLQAVLKRSRKNEPEVVGKLKNDALHKSISYDGEALELSKKEYEFLLLLMKHVNEPLPKELILDELWSASGGGSDGAIRVYVNRLKSLLPEIRIENIRGIGYKLVC
jgi:DNA-binding response OmpR family regulator